VVAKRPFGQIGANFLVRRSAKLFSSRLLMSNEGVTLISRVVLVAVLIIATAVARALVGPSKRRGFYMQIGTLGGMSGGVAVALLMSRWLATDVSVISACLGIFAGWAVAWMFVRHIPREAH